MSRKFGFRYNCDFQVSYVLIVQPPEEKEKNANDESGMNVYDFDADGDVDFGDSDGLDDDKAKVKTTAKRSQTVLKDFQLQTNQYFMQ